MILARYYEALRRIRRLEHDYDELYDSWLGALDRLHAAEQRMLAVEEQSCPMCAELQADRDDLALRLDAEIATRVWVEAQFMGRAG